MIHEQLEYNFWCCFLFYREDKEEGGIGKSLVFSIHAPLAFVLEFLVAFVFRLGEQLGNVVGRHLMTPLSYLVSTK